MSMSESEFTVNFFEALTRHIEAHHRGLTCRVPAPGMYSVKGYVVPSSDIIVENPDTGDVLAIEVKGGRYGAELPYATLPQLKAMRNALAPLRGRVALITAADIPEPVRLSLKNEHITAAKVSSVEEALKNLEADLDAIDSAASA